MGNLFDDIHKKFIQILNNHHVEYLLVGGMAVNLYGYHRGTGDVDIWVNTTEDNKQKLIAAINNFGYDTADLEQKNINDILVFSLGSRDSLGHIEIMNAVAGIKFEDAYAQTQIIDFENVKIKCIHYNDLIKNKLATARFKDLDDVEKLKTIIKAQKNKISPPDFND